MITKIDPSPAFHKITHTHAHTHGNIHTDTHKDADEYSIVAFCKTATLTISR